MKKTHTILNQNPFCLFEGKEVGLAEGYFAGDKFSTTSGDEYITEVAGRSFGWIDSQGDYWKNDKGNFTRPTVEQIHEALDKYPTLRDIALNSKYISNEAH